MPIWDSKEAIESGLGAIQEVVGDVAEILEGVPGDYGPSTQFNLVNVEIVRTDSPVELEDSRFSFRVKESNKRNSGWVLGLLAAYEKLGVKLPDGAYRRTRFVKTTIEYPKREGRDAINPWVGFIPVELVGVGNTKGKTTQGAAPAATQPVAVSGEEAFNVAVELLDGKTSNQFVRAVLLNRITRSDVGLKERVRNGKLQEELVAGEVFTVDASGVYHLVPVEA